MGNNGSICFQSKAPYPKGAELEALESVCKENDISFACIYKTPWFRPQASILQALVSLVFSSGIIDAIVFNIIPSGAYDLLKLAVVKLVKAMRGKNPSHEKVSCSSIIEIKSDSAFLHIESNEFYDETFNKAFDTFIEVSNQTNRKEHVIPRYVVIDEDDNVTVMGQNDYILKYVAHKEPKEDK